MGQHEQECNRNHLGSAKAMEKKAALELWTNTVARTRFRNRYVIHCFHKIHFLAQVKHKSVLMCASGRLSKLHRLSL